jgi:transcriptional regulator with XRE-family HTH domain
MGSLVETLKAKQEELGLDDRDFAGRLGISRPAWSMIRTGQRQPGEKVLAGVMRAFPSLGEDCLVYLRDRSGVSENVTRGYPTQDTEVA